jgi:hypothetical protein
MRYVKKPIIVEAFQLKVDCLTEDAQSNLPDWAIKALKDGVLMGDPDHKSTWIKTLEGLMHASKYDYIIQGIKGELYACKPDVFKKTYERVVG